MRYALAIVLLLAALSPAQAASEVLPVRLLYVESPGEQFTPDGLSAARTAALEALAWWYDRAPSPVAYRVTEELLIAVGNPFTAERWMAPYVTFENQILEIYIVANAHSGKMLYGHAGYAAPNYRAVFVVSDSVTGLAPAIAHELGHVLYGLPDLYNIPGACRAPDIMCYPAAPYRAGIVGCLSLAYLGNACERTYLPQVRHGAL